jgi:hypothetical protein
VTARPLATLSLLAALSACAALPAHDELLGLPAPHHDLDTAVALADGRARFRDIFCGALQTRAAGSDCSHWLWKLDDEPVLPLRSLPLADHRPQVYLVSGAFSECLGPDARPFNDAVGPLTAAGYRLEAIVVSGRSGPGHNAAQIAERIGAQADSGEPIVLIGYSKGANDILQFLVSYPELARRVESVVSVAGAVGGSPLADQAGGVYDVLFDWIPSARCPPGDGDVIDSLRPARRDEWLASHPLPDHVGYYSIAAFASRERVATALVPGWKLLLRHDLRNDGQVLAGDALIPGSTLLGYVDADHWSAAIHVEAVHPLLGARKDDRPFPREALLEAILLQLAEIRSASAPRLQAAPAGS